MKRYQFLSFRIADISDYLKVFIYTTVMAQPTMALATDIRQPAHTQDVFGLLYNLIKYTAPAFISGILYTAIRTYDLGKHFPYRKYFRSNWFDLFVPTIWWTSTCLLEMPWEQQMNKYYNSPTFYWQFVNGNVSPRLWYNTMMLQFITLMPLFWAISRYVGKNTRRGIVITIVTFILYFTWLGFYDTYVFHGIRQNDWYLLDRVFISFFIYGVYGVLVWQLRDYVNAFLINFWWLLSIISTIYFIWTNIELQGFGHPINFNSAPYHKPSMILYFLAVIALIAASCLHQVKKNSQTSLEIFCFLTTYTYRTYLSNVF